MENTLGSIALALGALALLPASHGRNGLLAAGTDLPAFVRAALPLAHDAALRASLGAAARDSVVIRFESIVAQVIDSGSQALMLDPARARRLGGTWGYRALAAVSRTTA